MAWSLRVLSITRPRNHSSKTLAAIVEPDGEYPLRRSALSEIVRDAGEYGLRERSLPSCVI